MKNLKFLAALLVAGGVLFAGAMTAPAFAVEPDGGKGTAQPAEKGKKDEKKDEKKAESKFVKAGEVAPAFTLTDTDGKTVSLSDYKGKVVVLEWFNFECPFSGVKHHKENKTFNELYENYNSKGVVFLAICSSAKGQQGSGKDKNAEFKKETSMPYAILLDESGTTGKAYGAKNTPHCIVIGIDGKVAYAGAIDNDKSKKIGDKNYVKMALDNVLAGKPAEPNWADPYGCGVKYAK